MILEDLRMGQIDLLESVKSNCAALLGGTGELSCAS